MSTTTNTTKNTTNDKAKTVMAYVKKLGYKVRATENDTIKKKRFTVIATRNKIDKSLCTITYSCKGEDVRINTGVKYKDSIYHEGWSGPYSSIVAYTDLNDILAELQEIKFTAKKETKPTTKKTETKPKQTETKQTNKPKQTKKTETNKAETKSRQTKSKADLKAELNALADATKK